MFEPMPLITVLIGAILLFAGGQLARLARLPESAGLGLTLGLIGITGVFVPSGFIQWAKGGDAGEYLLTIAKAAGVAGLLFIAGTRFDNNRVWSYQKLALYIIAAGLALIALTSIILVVIGKQQTSVAVTAGAIFAASSLWLTGELSTASKDERVFASAGASAVLAGLAALTIHLFTVLSSLAGKAPASTYLVVILYELVKAAVFLGFAYFITTRFLTLSENRIARARAIVAYVIINVLLFVLAARILGQLGAFAWAFIAGAIWTRSEEGRKFAASGKSVAIALLLSFSLLPLLLQTHGRTVSNWTVLLTVIIAALLLKSILYGISARAGGDFNSKNAVVVAAVTVAPVEILPAFLSVAVTTWEVGSEIYFGILIFNILAMIAGPLMLKTIRADDINASVEARRDGYKKQSKAKKQSRKNGETKNKKNGNAASKILL